MSSVENRLVISGVVDNRPQTRTTPAGIPISRFVLRHHSEQSEAGMRRQIQCTIGVMAAGAGLQEVIKQLNQGSEVSVAGFIGRANSRSGEYRLVLHATAIELAPQLPQVP